MSLIKKFLNTRIIEFLSVFSILFIFEIAFMLRFDYSIPLFYFIITLASIAIIPSILLLFKSSKTRFVLYALLLLISLILFVANSCLFYYKKDIFSFGMISDIGDGMNMGRKYDYFIAFGFGFWLFLFSYIALVVIVLINKLIKNYSIVKPRFKHALILFISIFVLIFPNIYIKEIDEQIYTSPQDKRTYLYTFGISSYNHKDFTSIISNFITQGSKKIKARDYLNDLGNDENTESELFGEFENKNIIMIMTETVEEYAIDKKLTPTLYELYYGKYSFTNAYGVGKSNYTYDAEFKSLTSMMYYNSDNIMHSYYKNEYMNALPHVLRKQGYSTASFHSFTGVFFNRVNMHPALGFEKSYFEENMTFSNTDFWALDSEMFLQMKDLIVPIQDNPFLSFITTLTTHGDYNEKRTELEPYYDIIDKDDRFNKREIQFKTLLAAQMDLDKGLETMLADLESKGLSEDTLIVIYSDHKNYSSHEITENYSENIMLKEFDYDRIPFAIYHPSLETTQFTDITSHYDITPTILDLLGIKYKTSYYYGQSVFLYLSNNYVNKPLIFGFNRWIHKDMIVYDKEIIYYNPDFSETEIEKCNMKIREEVYATIEKYHAFFLTDYFRETALE